jgi:LPXTG-motif cell wall-anchored protein
VAVGFRDEANNQGVAMTANIDALISLTLVAQESAAYQAGQVVGTILGLALIAGVIWLLLPKKKRK